MKLVIEDDFNRVIMEMKSAHQVAAQEIRTLKRTLKGKDSLQSSETLRAIEGLEKRQNFYSVGSINPVEVNGIVINYKLIEAFLKKLKSFYTDVSIDGDSLFIRYGSSPSNLTNVLELHDISSYYKGFQHVPKGELVNG